MTETLTQKLATLPTRSGVYQFRSSSGAVLYVGKAKNLRSRVRSYFREGNPREGRIRLLVRRTEDVDVIVTDNESEALILENNLIKTLKPRYNINLKDDKTYPYICIKNEIFPRIFSTRTVRKDGSRYFGPYTDVKNMKRALRAIRSIFKVRTCSLHLAPEPIMAGKYQTCLEYHIQKCAGPCVGYQTEANYNETIAQIEKLLNGHTKALVQVLEDDMQRAASQLLFEEAAQRRNQIVAVRKYAQRQKVVSTDNVDRDLFALCVDREENVAAAVLFKVREGKVVGRQHKYLQPVDGSAEEDLMQTWLEHYYTGTTFFPDEVYLSVSVAHPEPLEAFLWKKRGKKVVFHTPQRGEKADLMKMIEANAQLLVGDWKLQQTKRGEDRIPYAVKALQKDLRLSHLPRRIECFDISHLGGTGTVASCVVFERGQPRKRDYRSYKIHGVEEGKPDDFLSMQEVIARRYRRVKDESGPWPDLVVVDGGKGQLSSAVEALKGEGVYGKFPVIGLSKRLEEVYFPGDTDPRHIAKQSASLQLIQRVRDEAHRFAIELQRKQRKRRLLHSELLAISGIGPKTVQKLVKAFGSVRRIKEASEEELVCVVGPKLAQRIRAYAEESSQ